MKILVVSDTHGENRNYIEALKRERPLDCVIHCGDCGRTEDRLREAAGCPFYIVAGNTDYYSTMPRDRIIEKAGHTIMVTHGHYYYVNRGVDMLRQYAAAEGADIVCFGHTHVPFIKEEKDMLIVNPGSLSSPRQENGMPSYAVMEIDEQGKVSCEIKYLI